DRDDDQELDQCERRLGTNWRGHRPVSSSRSRRKGVHPYLRMQTRRGGGAPSEFLGVEAQDYCNTVQVAPPEVSTPPVLAGAAPPGLKQMPPEESPPTPRTPVCPRLTGEAAYTNAETPLVPVTAGRGAGAVPNVPAARL